MAEGYIARLERTYGRRPSQGADLLRAWTARQTHQSRLAIGMGTALLGVTCVLALFTAMECYRFNSLVVPHFPWAPSMLYGAAFWLWWAVVGLALWQVTKRWAWTTRIAPLNVLVQSVAGLALTALHLFLMHLVVTVTPLIWPIAQRGTDSSLRFFDPVRISLDVLVYSFICTTCVAIRFHMLVQQDTLNALTFERQLSEAKLRALQAQLEPHFLFNTLNAISALVNLDRQQQASAMLAHLNVILRGTLARSSSLKVKVAQELDIMENYLAIEQIRFADRLRTETTVDPAALDCMVPSFLLQPLLENAIRHGIAQCEEAGVIQTIVSVEGDTLRMCICDNGPGRRAGGQKGHGVGLQNTADRLSHLYPECHTMQIVEPEDGGFEVRIAIPFERFAS